MRTIPFPEEIDLSPEFRLLCACSWIAPSSFTASQAGQIAAFCSESIDWRHFLDLVDRHRLPVLAYALLCRHARACIPDSAYAALKVRHDRAREQALRNAAEGVRLTKLLANHGIIAMPLKGAFLSLRLYGDVGIRQTSDTDLMVRPESVSLAEQLLQAEGYHPHEAVPGLRPTPKQRRFIRAAGYHEEYLHEHRGLRVELHWAHQLWTSRQMNMLWEHAQPVEWLGVPVMRLDDGTLLLTLCDHGAKHRWFRVKWLGDIAALFAQERAGGWETLLDVANRLDQIRPLAQAALLVQWLYDVTLPDALAERITLEKTARPLAVEAVRAMLLGEQECMIDECSGNDWTRARTMMRLRTRPSYALLLKRFSLSVWDFNAVPLPDAMFWLYYPLRPLLWLWRMCCRRNGRD